MDLHPKNMLLCVSCFVCAGKCFVMSIDICPQLRILELLLLHFFSSFWWTGFEKRLERVFQTGTQRRRVVVLLPREHVTGGNFRDASSFGCVSFVVGYFQDLYCLMASGSGIVGHFLTPCVATSFSLSREKRQNQLKFCQPKVLTSEAHNTHFWSCGTQSVTLQHLFSADSHSCGFFAHPTCENSCKMWQFACKQEAVSLPTGRSNDSSSRRGLCMLVLLPSELHTLIEILYVCSRLLLHLNGGSTPFQKPGRLCLKFPAVSVP